MQLKDIKDKIESKLKKNEKDLINFLLEIISIPSLSGHEKNIAKRIKVEMEKTLFDEVYIDTIGNVIGKIGNGPINILYDSHMDTVSVGDINTWSRDPFLGEIKDGYIYGRGASDSKAGLAGMVYAGKLIKELISEKQSHNFTLYVIGTVQEEDCTGCALKYAINNSLARPDYVILSEPTGLNINCGHRGKIELIITKKGKTCSSSSPHLGVNPIYEIQPLIVEIEELNKKLKEDKLGRATIAITNLECEIISLNSIPNSVTIYVDRRLILGENKETVISEIKNLKNFKNCEIKIANYSKASYTSVVMEEEKYYNSWLLNSGHDLIQKASDCFKIVFNKEAKFGTWGIGTNGVGSMGVLGIPTIGLGPSREKHAHTIDDKVAVDEFLSATKFYSMLPWILAEKI
jgi:putative selenium metabolism hydrolase